MSEISNFKKWILYSEPFSTHAILFCLNHFFTAKLICERSTETQQMIEPYAFSLRLSHKLFYHSAVFLYAQRLTPLELSKTFPKYIRVWCLYIFPEVHPNNPSFRIQFLPVTENRSYVEFACRFYAAW